MQIASANTVGRFFLGGPGVRLVEWSERAGDEVKLRACKSKRDPRDNNSGGGRKEKINTKNSRRLN